MSLEIEVKKRGPAYLLDMQAFLRPALMLGAALFLVGSLGAAPAQAQTDEISAEQAPPAQADSLTLLGGLIEIIRPDGWSFVPAGPEALATLRSNRDEEAQIEVRSSDGVTATRWENYRRTFDTELQQTGFIVHRVQESASFGERPGALREYELPVEGLSYRLLIWHSHSGDRAWIFAAFFPANRRNIYLQTFEEFLTNIEWNDS